MNQILRLGLLLGCLNVTAGCGYQSLEPGHIGLRYAPLEGGLQTELLKPGTHSLGWCFLRNCGRIDEFDVTFSTKHVKIVTQSQEGLMLDLQLAVIYRPIIAELYELDTEIGPNYYDEVVAPEFRSAARGVFSRHPYMEVTSKNEKLEDEIETNLRRRIKGKHVEIASVTLEAVSYAPEIADAVRAKLVAVQETARQKAALENEALRRKTMLETEAAGARLKEENRAAQLTLEARNQMEQEKRRLEIELARKKNERVLAEEQTLIEKAQATSKLINARGKAERMTLLARAEAEHFRALQLRLSPLDVQIAAYEAMGKLGGTGTTLFLGDFGRMPQGLVPPLYMPPLFPWGGLQGTNPGKR